MLAAPSTTPELKGTGWGRETRLALELLCKTLLDWMDQAKLASEQGGAGVAAEDDDDDPGGYSSMSERASEKQSQTGAVLFLLPFLPLSLMWSLASFSSPPVLVSIDRSFRSTRASQLRGSPRERLFLSVVGCGPPLPRTVLDFKKWLLPSHEHFGPNGPQFVFRRN